MGRVCSTLEIADATPHDLRRTGAALQGSGAEGKADHRTARRQRAGNHGNQDAGDP